ncbi:MAG: DUF1489 domain-containing protein [Alphaproteobacteria bacterium]|nr:DUF1489 domain-containing protein [Alphaproteobacteria bacterium]MBU2041189.1 DUF1489 domain-containing protein [Alphaproteobacteria bacterium]MBU2125498.1 DUF1489 domain-containing protein [Alphaproteobacteria bacterium]MBU2209497.1 DUF1489 domain-containing protein [Alphaproteobacteria bacterium]MBU2290265.1 DUF1489 domain-containing protein [Alphaproteobacteria bacterium]
MPLHMIKLCVGVAKVETLERRAAKGEWLTVQTRMTPKRTAELEDGGSLFWVMKGSVTCRMPILDVSTRGEGKASMCHIKLSPEVVRTAPQARRPFQGWRYLEPKDAPMDLSSLDAGEVPEDLAKRLREMGAW